MKTRKYTTAELAANIANASNGALVLDPGHTYNHECYAQFIHTETGTPISMSYWVNRGRPEFYLACLDYVDERGEVKRLSPHDAIRYDKTLQRPTVDPDRPAKAIAAHVLRWVNKEDTQKVAQAMRDCVASREAYARAKDSAVTRIGAALNTTARAHAPSTFNVNGPAGNYHSFECMSDTVKAELRLTLDEAEKLIAYMKQEGIL
jgi:hypothetical protein